MKKLFLISLTATLIFALALSVCDGSGSSTKPIPPSNSLIIGAWVSGSNVKPAVTLKTIKCANSGHDQSFGTYYTYQGEIACSVFKNGKVTITGDLPSANTPLALAKNIIAVYFDQNSKAWTVVMNAHDGDYDKYHIVDNSCLVSGSLITGQIVGRVAIRNKDAANNIYDTPDIINHPDKFTK